MKWIRYLATVLILLAALALVACEDEEVETAPLSGETTFNFDDGTLQGWTATGLWHVSAVRSVSPLNSARYADPVTGTFDTGLANSGNLTSPPIDLAPLGPNPALSFDHFLSNECGGDGIVCVFDKLTVLISIDGGLTFTQIADLPTATTAFVNTVLDLTAFAGQTIVIRFNFDTIDAGINAFEGAYVDNITFK